MTVAAPNCRPSLRQEFERGVITEGHVEVIYEIRPSSQTPGAHEPTSNGTRLSTG
jgi:hypothetical protein